MKLSETIRDIYTRFTNVINDLKGLGKGFLDFELVNKVLRSLPKSWDPKVTTFQEVKDLNNFTLEELIGSLMTYKMTYKAHEELEDTLPKKRKNMVLKTQDDHLKENSSDEDLDEDLTLLTRKLKKFIKTNKFINDTKKNLNPRKIK